MTLNEFIQHLKDIVDNQHYVNANKELAKIPEFDSQRKFVLRSVASYLEANGYNCKEEYDGLIIRKDGKFKKKTFVEHYAVPIIIFTAIVAPLIVELTKPILQNIWPHKVKQVESSVSDSLPAKASRPPN